MHASTELPAPGADALAHSETLASLIAQRIAAAGGWLDFSDYMQLALYAPGLGYYSAGATKFGAAGDFVTAPEVSDLFGRCLARAIAPVVAGGAGRSVLELGAGTGALAAVVLPALAAAGALPERYLILEVSAELRERQRRLLAERMPELLARVDWLDALPTAIDGVVMANEVIDALPVARFRIGTGADRVRALGVCTAGDGFGWAERPAPRWLRECVAGIEAAAGTPLPAGYVAEVSPRLPEFVAGVAAALNDGTWLIIDYGLPRRELYAPERADGTLICHYRHRSHADPFRYPGLQDITAWVDFTALAEAGVGAGMEVGGYATQAQFLIAAGIDEEFSAASQAAGDAAARAARSREAQTLLLPGEMGEKFKVMWLAKGGAAPPPEFAVHDQRHRL
jgi:SAM-dependent MidA family methyltransferase